MKYQPRGVSRNPERELRKRATPAEELAWTIFRSRGLNRWKFRRQHRIENLVLDFYCPRLRVNVEFDGAPHFTDEGRASDSARDARLVALGFVVIRIENANLIANPRIVANEILRVCELRAREYGYL